MGLTDLLRHDGKAKPDEKMMFVSQQRCKGGNRDYRSLFSVIFETVSKSSITFLRLVFGKEGVDRVAELRREMDVRYGPDLKVILKYLGST